MSQKGTDAQPIDVVLVGAGIMSATVAALLKELQPDLQIEIFELHGAPAEESSDAWNNAGTGHAAYMEMNYTPRGKDGTIDITKALAINTEFDLSRQFWAHLVRKGAIPEAASFIHSVPHMGIAFGEDQIAFLKQRHATMTAHHCFQGMELSEDRRQITEWIPLVMEGRDKEENVAVTRVVEGSDVDFGSLTVQLLDYALEVGACRLHCHSPVTDLEREPGAKHWTVTVHDRDAQSYRQVQARFVFLGAGGNALPLLQRSDIPESKGYAGFPVSGIWLRCDDETLAARHHAKVYGMADVGAPPMSVPHLDKRVIDGQPALLFGPYAGTSPRFLKHGSPWALLRSIRLDNISQLLAAGADNLDLIRYLAGQVVQSEAHRFEALRRYYPLAREQNWILQAAGQRVQIIESGKDGEHHGVLKFGTELIRSADGTLIALLGASPGASTAVWVAIELIRQCFPDRVNGTWGKKLRKLIPSYGKSLIDDAALCRKVRSETADVLGLVPAA